MGQCKRRGHKRFQREGNCSNIALMSDLIFLTTVDMTIDS
jgi:hypothetical protein